MNMKVIRCEHTRKLVLFDIEANICRHNESTFEDEVAVKDFNRYTEKYLSYIADNGLENDYNSITYAELIAFVNQNIED